MTLTITPGYDFGANEVPTASSWGKQASDVQLKDIPLSSVDSDLSVVGLQGSSSASNLPNEGSLWVDHQTNVWGRTRWGAVKVRMYGGAIETNRFSTRSLSKFVLPGQRMELSGDGSDYTTASCAVLEASGVGGTPGIFIASATIASGASDGQYWRVMVGPGYVPIYTLARNPLWTDPHRQEILTNTPAVNYFTLQGFSSKPLEGTEGDVVAQQTNELNGETSATCSYAYLYGGMIGGILEIT